MLIFAGVRKGSRWTRRRFGRRENEPAAAIQGGSVGAVAAEETRNDAGASSWHHGHHGLPGHHHHARPEPDEDFVNYGRATAFVVGMIHGIGAETPTQVLIFLAAAGAGGFGVGLMALGMFIFGLLTSNSVITLGSTFGYLRASKNFAIYATVALLTGTFSLVIGTIFLLGRTTLLPAIFGG